MGRPKTIITFEYLEKMVDKSTGCWIWKGYTNNYGYPRIKVNYKHQLAHVISYTYYIGEVPDDLCVLHKCDIRKCINPEHLFLGTRGENNTDRHNKGRDGKNYTWKTHCTWGHERKPKNLRANGNCIACGKERKLREKNSRLNNLDNNSKN